MPRWGAKRTAAQKREVGGPGRRPENSLNVRATALHPCTSTYRHSSHEASTSRYVLGCRGSENLSKRAETALNMCAPGVCRETRVESLSKKIILASPDWPRQIVL